MSDGIPLPRPTPLSRPHWDGCRQGVLRAQRCDDCGSWVFIPQPICTTCQSPRLHYRDTSGRGTVYSYTVVHRAPRPAFATPYVVAIVELEEGFHMLTNVLGCAAETVYVGMPVEVELRAMSEEITLPYFRPAR